MFEYNAYFGLNSHRQPHPDLQALPREGPGGSA